MVDELKDVVNTFFKEEVKKTPKFQNIAID